MYSIGTLNSTGVLIMQASTSKLSASLVRSAAISGSSKSVVSGTFLRSRASAPTVTGDIAAVIVWVAMVPSLMWLGHALGL